MARVRFLHFVVALSLIKLHNAALKDYDPDDKRNTDSDYFLKNTKYYNKEKENTIITDREKVIAMSRELLLEIKLKVHQTDGIRNEMGSKKSLLFELGVLLGQIREKHKTQLEHYRQMRDKHDRKERHFPPEYDKFGLLPYHFVIALEKIHAKELEIDNMIEAILRLPKSMLDEAPPKPIELLRMEPLAKPGLQAAASEDEDNDDPEMQQVTEKETSKRTLTEEDIKRMHRLEYMKRHNIRE